MAQDTVKVIRKRWARRTIQVPVMVKDNSLTAAQIGSVAYFLSVNKKAILNLDKNSLYPSTSRQKWVAQFIDNLSEFQEKVSKAQSMTPAGDK